MPWKRDNPGCDCCGCERVDDQFDTDTIANYTQSIGSWAIADGVLATSSANAVLKANTTGQIYQRVATRFRSPDRQRVKVLAGMTSATQYLYALVTFDDDPSACGWLEIRNKTVGDDERIGERLRVTHLDPDVFHDLSLCVQPNSDLSEAALYAALDGACVYALLEQTPGVGAGLGTGDATGDVEFTSFLWTDSKTEDNECPDCGCDCVTSGDGFGSIPPSGLDLDGEDDIGCLWKICAPNWRLTGGLLAGWGDADVQHLVPIDPRAESQYASVEARGSGGTKALLHMAMACGSASSLSAVIEFSDAPGKSKVAISKDNGSTYETWKYIDTAITQFGTGRQEFTKLTACLKDDRFHVEANSQRVQTSASDAGDELFCGLGVRYHAAGEPVTGLREPVFFDEFEQGDPVDACGKCESAEGVGGGVCSHCIDEVPRHLLVTQPSMSSAGCANCADHAGNYLLPQRVQDDGAELCCVWSAVTTAGCPATAAGGTASLCFDGTDYVLRYVLSGRFFNTITESHAWSVNLGADKPDCTTFNETLPLDSTAGGCSATGTTVTIKAA